MLYLCYFFVNEYNENEKDMDWSSYMFAKTAKLYLTNPFPRNDSFSLSLMRKLYDFSLTAPTAIEVSKYPELAAIKTDDLRIPVEGSTIPIRIYNAEKGSKNLKPVMVWYHGGGMIIGSMEGAHGNCLKFANHTNFIIVNVDYRLAPEFIYPTPFHDAYTAFLWVEENIKDYGGNPKELFVGGDSAGGYLATAITARYISEHFERAKVECSANAQTCSSVTSLPNMNIIGLVDIYPGLNSTSTSEEAKLVGKASGILPIEEPEWMRSLYQGSPVPDFTIRNHYWFSPFYTPNEYLSFFPRTILILAKYDVLTPESLEFKKKLDSFHIPVYYSMYHSTVHAFFGSPMIPAGNIALAETSEFMKLILQEHRTNGRNY